MNRNISRRTGYLATALAGFIGLAALSMMSAAAAAEVPDNFDNQGGKLFAAQQQTPTGNLTADSGGRTLSKFYELRQYPGSPPRIPHVVDLSFSGNETDCLSCHRKGGYSPEFNAFAPVTPHPENILCSQCHTLVQGEELFVETDWLSISPPRLGQSFLPGSPPAIPHSLQLRRILGRSLTQYCTPRAFPSGAMSEPVLRPAKGPVRRDSSTPNSKAKL